MVLSLAPFCHDMQRLAAVIDAPANWVPACGQDGRSAYCVSLSEDKQRYVLTYMEKDDTEPLIESSDENVVMERIFVEVTTNMATEAVARSGPPFDGQTIANITPLQVGNGAVDFQIRFSAIQEALLGRLNPNWQTRRATWNAKRLQQTRDLFDQ